MSAAVVDASQSPPSADELFLRAASAGDLERCRALLESDGTVINVVDEEGTSALIAAAASGSAALVEFLLQRGAALDHRSYVRWDALTAACHRGHDAIASILLKAGLKPDVCECGEERAAACGLAHFFRCVDTSPATPPLCRRHSREDGARLRAREGLAGGRGCASTGDCRR